MVLARLDSDTLEKYRVQQTRRSAQVGVMGGGVGVGGVIEACPGQRQSHFALSSKDKA